MWPSLRSEAASYARHPSAESHACSHASKRPDCNTMGLHRPDSDTAAPGSRDINRGRGVHTIHDPSSFWLRYTSVSQQVPQEPENSSAVDAQLRHYDFDSRSCMLGPGVQVWTRKQGCCSGKFCIVLDQCTGVSSVCQGVC